MFPGYRDQRTMICLDDYSSSVYVYVETVKRKHDTKLLLLNLGCRHGPGCIGHRHSLAIGLPEQGCSKPYLDASVDRLSALLSS